MEKRKAFIVGHRTCEDDTDKIAFDSLHYYLKNAKKEAMELAENTVDTVVIIPVYILEE